MTTTLYPTRTQHPAHNARRARAQVSRLRLACYRDADMHYVRIVDTRTGAVLARMELVHEDAHGNEYEFEPGLDMELAKALVSAFNGRKQA